MAVIYLKDHRSLTKEQKQMAETALSNEINDVMADLEIIEEELGRTAIFGELHLRAIAADYLNRKLKCTTDGSYDEKVLQEVYRWYFPE